MHISLSATPQCEAPGHWCLKINIRSWCDRVVGKNSVRHQQVVDMCLSCCTSNLDPCYWPLPPSEIRMKLLAMAWPSPNYWGSLGNEIVDKRSHFPSVFSHTLHNCNFSNEEFLKKQTKNNAWPTCFMEISSISYKQTLKLDNRKYDFIENKLKSLHFKLMHSKADAIEKLI